MHDDVIFYRLPKIAGCSSSTPATPTKMWAYLRRARPAAPTYAARSSTAARADRGARSASRRDRRSRSATSIVGGGQILLLRRRRRSTARPRSSRAPGYTGEDGFELFVDGADAPRLWRALARREARCGLEPCRARRARRASPRSGHAAVRARVDRRISPLAGGQGWAVKSTKPRVRRQRCARRATARATTSTASSGSCSSGRVPAREGYPVFSSDERVGEIRSAFASRRRCGNQNVATALVAQDASRSAARALDVEIRGTRHGARVVAASVLQTCESTSKENAMAQPRRSAL